MRARALEKISNKEQQEEKLFTPVVTEDKPFSPEDVVELWKTYVESLSKSSLLFLKSRKAEPVENQVVLWLASNHEKELIMQERTGLVQFFRSRLKNGNIDFDFRIDNSIQPEKQVLSQEEKFKLMAQKNPLLNELKNALGLELEY